MEHPAGETPEADFQLGFDRRLKLEFHGSRVTSDAGLLAFRDLDNALGLTELAGELLADTRTGRNGRHTLTAQVRQAIFGPGKPSSVPASHLRSRQAIFGPGKPSSVGSLDTRT